MARPMSPMGETTRPVAAPDIATPAAVLAAAPTCPQCGFHMTPLRLARGLEVAAFDGVFECRPCGVMQMPDTARQSRTPSRRR